MNEKKNAHIGRGHAFKVDKKKTITSKMLENIRRALNKYDNRSVETMVFTKAAAVAANNRTVGLIPYPWWCHDSKRNCACNYSERTRISSAMRKK